MKKIPTMFERDWEGDRSRVLAKITPGCEWVQAGEGLATRKIDGTACRYSDGRWWKRRELRQGDVMPPDFVTADQDAETGKTVGWVPIGDGPEDRWARDAITRVNVLRDGTYELVGPKVQGNPEGYPQHTMVAHHSATLWVAETVPRDFDGIKAWLADKDIEGIVFHHPDGRMAKIKLRDFGLKRRKAAA